MAPGGAAALASLRPGDVLLCTVDELSDALDSGPTSPPALSARRPRARPRGLVRLGAARRRRDPSGHRRAVARDSRGAGVARRLQPRDSGRRRLSRFRRRSTTSAPTSSSRPAGWIGPRRERHAAVVLLRRIPQPVWTLDALRRGVARRAAPRRSRHPRSSPRCRPPRSDLAVVAAEDLDSLALRRRPPRGRAAAD